MNDAEPEHSVDEIKDTIGDPIFTVLCGEYYETDQEVLCTLSDQEQAIARAKMAIDRNHWADVWKTYLDHPEIRPEYVTSEFVE